MKRWMEKKNEPKATVQQRWDNKEMLYKAFRRWKLTTGSKNDDKREKQKTGRERRKMGRYICGVKHSGRVRAIPKIHIQVKNFLVQTGIG
eukprot:6187406-Pleurochrysis_carterae.AAC.6